MTDTQANDFVANTRLSPVTFSDQAIRFGIPKKAIWDYDRDDWQIIADRCCDLGLTEDEALCPKCAEYLEWYWIKVGELTDDQKLIAPPTTPQIARLTKAV